MYIYFGLHIEILANKFDFMAFYISDAVDLLDAVEISVQCINICLRNMKSGAFTALRYYLYLLV